MDPEDVLDFGEDDDGLDVISLGASDHDGRPVSNRSSSTVPDCASSKSRGTPHVRPSSPSRTRHVKSPHPQLNGPDRSRLQPTPPAQNPPQGPLVGRRYPPVSNSNRSTSNADRPQRESSFRESNRSTMVEPPRTRLPCDRPKPGERASYMPPHRLQELSKTPRTSDHLNSRNKERHPVQTLTTRITDHPSADPKIESHSNLSKLTRDPDRSEETIEVKKPTSEGKKGLKPPVRSSVDPSTVELPEGWISRISKAGKTYYVNGVTRTSQWARPTEPAVDKQLKPTGKVTSESLSVQPIPAEKSQKPADITEAHVQKPDVIIIGESSSVAAKPAPNSQFPSRSLHDSPDQSRSSNKAALHDSSRPAKSSVQVRHPEAPKLVDHMNRQSNFVGSGSIQGFGHDTSPSCIPQESPHSAVSEPYPRGPRIHPDRRQEIVAASLNSPPSGSKKGDEYRRAEYVRCPQEPETFRPRANPRPRSVSPDPRWASSHRSLERHPREPVQLSGANGIPKAPGRSFPNERTHPRSSKDFNADPDSSRYNQNVYTPCLPSKEQSDHRNPDWWRGPSDDSMNRKMVSHDRIPAQWPSRPPSPVHYPHPRRLSPRPRSPPPSPRRISSHQDFQRGLVQPGLHRSERSRLPPASTRMLQENRPSKPPQSSDLMRRNTNSRYDAYRPSSSSPVVSNGMRLQDSRRGGASPLRDQGPRHIDHREVGERKSHAIKPTSVLTDQRKTSPVLAQSHLHRPHSQGLVALRQSPRRAPPPKDNQLIDLDAVLSKSDTLPGPLTEQTPDNLPSEMVSQGNPNLNTSHSSALQGHDRAEDFEASKPPKNNLEPLTNSTSEPPTLTVPMVNDGNEATCISNCEVKKASENRAKSSSDIIMMSSPPRAVSPKQIVPLVKRLGPVASNSSEFDQLTPPTKRHRRNPVDKIQADYRSDVLPDDTKESSLEDEKNLSNNTEPISKDTSEISKTQPEPEEQLTQMVGSPETPLSSSQVPKDKVISLRGRAARASGEVGVVHDQPASKVQDNITGETISTGGGSLRDRIQDLNFPPVRPIRSRLFSQPDSSNQSSAVTPAHDAYQTRSALEGGLPPSRHISERISGIRARVGHSPPPNGNHRSSRYTPRQSDSGWRGRRARHS